VRVTRGFDVSVAALRRQRLAWRGFEPVFRRFRERRIEAIHIAGAPPWVPRSEPLLLVANHVSWWDGFLLREIQRLLRPDAFLCVAVDEQELRRHRVLRALGGVPLQPGSRASVRALLRGLESARTAHPELSILFFPQGRIWPSHRRPLGFQRGIARIAARIAPAVVLPVGLHIEPLNTLRPHAFVSVADPLYVDARFDDDRLVERLVESQLDRTLDLLTQCGEAAPRVWPSLHEPLPTPSGTIDIVPRLGGSER
jgi:1-acyl-sn-glycerol-3-phosphate acyltransferase